MDIDWLIKKYTPECVAMTQELIRIPSVNGQHTEAALVRYVMQKAFELDLYARKLEYESDRPNIVIGENRKKKKGIAFVSHSDTVPVGDESKWTHDPFGGMKKEGKIWWRGAIDCKSGIAVSLYAMKILHELGYPELAKMLVGVDEENGANSAFGIQQVLEHGFDAEGAIYVYGWSNERNYINVAHRGLMRMVITCTGKEWHAGGSDREFRRKGDNAVEGIIDCIYRLQQERPFQHFVHPFFPGYRTMFTPIHIQWGIDAAIIPWNASVTIDIRTLPSVKNTEILAFIDFFLRQISTDTRQYAFHLKSNVPATVSDTDTPFISKTVHYLKQRYQLDTIFFKGSGPANETYMFVNKGISMVAWLWPIGSGFHGADEYAEVASFQDSLHALVHIALAMKAKK